MLRVGWPGQGSHSPSVFLLTLSNPPSVPWHGIRVFRLPGGCGDSEAPYYFTSTVTVLGERAGLWTSGDTLGYVNVPGF